MVLHLTKIFKKKKFKNPKLFSQKKKTQNCREKKE